MVRRRRDGIALLLVSGLLLPFGLFLVLATGVWRVQQALGVRATGARHAAIAAESGLAYAAARLMEEGIARGTDLPSGRGDDWTRREGSRVRVEGSANPSYSHGEPWADSIRLSGNGIDDDNDGLVDEPEEGDGSFISGEAWTDLDGDGRFSAWTGRLRGGRGPFDGRFSLAVASPEGLLPVNAGYLDTLDRNGNGVPDSRDPDVDAYHRGLAHVLNNLGALLLPYPACPRRDDLPTGDPAGSGHTFRLSWLGDDLLGRRPPGGYRDGSGLEKALVEAGYRPEDVERIRPFLDLGPYDGPAETGRVRGREQYDVAPYVPVNLYTAPREVLRALWLYIAHAPRFGSEIDPLYGETQGDRSPYPHAGPLDAPDFLPYEYVDCHMIYPEETDRLADRLIRLRRAGSLSWQGLLKDLMGGAGDLFREEVTALDAAGAPVSKRNLLRYKAEIAFQVLANDPHPFDGALSGLATWDGWGIDADGNPANGVQQSRAIGFHMLQRVLYPDRPGDGWPGGHGMSDYKPFTIEGDGIAPQGGSLAAPARFEVASHGRSGDAHTALVSGRLVTEEGLEFTSQEDFEVLGGGAGLARRGIAVLGEPSRDARPENVPAVFGGGDHVRLDCRHVASLPRWSRRAITSDRGGPPYYGQARTCGALALAALETGPQGSAYYWPFHEDADRDASTDFRSENPAGPVVRYPVRLTPYNADDSATTPHQVSGSLFSDPFPCPGWTDAAEVPLQAASIDFWLGPEGYVKITDAAKWYEVGVYSYRDFSDPGRPATVFRVRVDWRNRWVDWVWDYWNDFEEVRDFRVEDGTGLDPLDGHAHHVALSLSYDGTATRFSLFIDGRDYATRPSDGPMSWMRIDPETGADGGLVATPEICLFLRRADEFRFHDRELAREDAEKLYRLGRFVRSGVYASPIYVFDAPARLTRAQWNGLVPPRLRDASGNPFTSLRVEVIAYDEAGAPRSVWLGPSGPIDDLSPTGLSKAFRYKVYFNCNPAAGVLTDTPVFESIRLSFRRRGKSPAWTAWGSR